MTAISINSKNRTIELTKTFATASSKFGTPEYDQLQQARKDYPNYKVVTIARKATKSDKPSYKGLTYEYMEKYILRHDNAEENMAEYMELRGISEEGEEALAESFNYQEMKDWLVDGALVLDADIKSLDESFIKLRLDDSLLSSDLVRQNGIILNDRFIILKKADVASVDLSPFEKAPLLIEDVLIFLNGGIDDAAAD